MVIPREDSTSDEINILLLSLLDFCLAVAHAISLLVWIKISVTHENSHNRKDKVYAFVLFTDFRKMCI